MSLQDLHFRITPIFLAPFNKPKYQKYRLYLQRGIRIYGKSSLVQNNEFNEHFQFEGESSNNLFDFQMLRQNKNEQSFQFLLYGVNSQKKQIKIQTIAFDVSSEVEKYHSVRTCSFEKQTTFPQAQMQLHWIFIVNNLKETVKLITSKLMPLSLRKLRSGFFKKLITEEKSSQKQNTHSQQLFTKIVQSQSPPKPQVEMMEEVQKVEAKVLQPLQLFTQDNVLQFPSQPVQETQKQESNVEREDKSELKLSSRIGESTEDQQKQKSELEKKVNSVKMRNIIIMIVVLILIVGMAGLEIYLDQPKTKDKVKGKKSKR